MRSAWCLVAALLITAFAWVAGGPIGVWFIRPGYLVMGLLDKAVAVAGAGPGKLLSLRGWFWTGAMVNVAVWWGALVQLTTFRARLIRAVPEPPEAGPGRAIRRMTLVRRR